MPNVVFAAPFAMENTLRFVRAAATLPGVRLCLISQDPQDKVPQELRQLLAGYLQVRDAMAADQLTDAVRALGRQLGSVDALLGVLEPLQVPLAEVRQRLRIPGMDPATAHNFRDKAAMKQVLAAHDLPCARHQLCATVEQGQQFAQRIGFPLVVKPPAGMGAKTTVRVENEADLLSLLASMPPAPGSEVLLEEFVRGEEFSFDTITLHGRHLFHNIGRYLPTPLQVLENPWIQWCVLLPAVIDTPEFAAIHDIGTRALDALGMWTGMSHMEWFRRADGSVVIGEVAARPPGAQFMTLMSHAHDADLYQAWARLSIFASFAPVRRVYAAGAAYLRGQGEGRVVAIRGLEEAQRRIGALVVEANLPQPGQPKASSYEGEGYVIVRHKDTAVVEAALHTLVSTLRIELG